eukprot:CAMPEP_0175753180 /NCGR_PEP_ID=MMETSP0097-20121207/62165_1 /TAXON_ID=311494 /ORGANISM="Alexandrium monilatum, Strain CCMP3105" /LENGTH=53 /DNA_ID=CAMNT_0017062023 /DNA_START=82 /DNA_END=240 /DNA_ORIENTATION=-
MGVAASAARATSSSWAAATRGQRGRLPATLCAAATPALPACAIRRSAPGPEWN